MCSSTSPSPQSPGGETAEDAQQGSTHSDIAVSTAVSSAATLNTALADAVSRCLANLAAGGSPDLAIIFISVRYSVMNVGQSGRHSMDLVVPRLRALIPTLKGVVGCTSDGVIGAGPTGDIVEVENSPSVSLTLMRLPGITITPFHVMPDDLPSPDARQDAWHTLINRTGPKLSDPSFMIFSDPTFADRGGLDRFLTGLQYAYPDSPAVGALASAGAAFPTGHMFCTLPRDVLSPEATSLRDSGLVGLAFSGDVHLDCLVSHGCRSIGPEFEIRKVTNGNVVLEMELVGRPSSCLPATGQLKSIISYATASEKEFMDRRLHVGISKDEYGRAEDNYQIRHVIGVDLYDGGITVANPVRVGQRMRFFILDEQMAQETLDKTMQRYKRVELANSVVGYSKPPFAAMVFVDVARGRALFNQPAMETKNLTDFAHGVPVSGCFTGGQIGPARTVEERGAGGSMLHMAANLIALVRRRSGLLPVDDGNVQNDGV